MWKDFFYFQRGQRVAILLLLALIVITVLLCNVLPLFFKTETVQDEAFVNQVNEFHSRLLRRDSLENLARQNRYKRAYEPYQPKYERYENRYTLFVFDPNNADSADFVALGLKPYIASNILKFRERGGKFRSSSDFSKIYGITAEKFAELETYISIQTAENQSGMEILTEQTETKAFSLAAVTVELNIADTAELMQVQGIGRTYARRIVALRQKLGGFASVEQLREIYGMTDENFEKIRKNTTVNTSLLTPLKINTASVDKLNTHPYLNFYQSKAIYELRRRKIKLKNIDELRQLDELKDADIERITPYLSFE